MRVLSAHRTPEQAAAFVREATAGGTKVFICGAGGAAHLAGAVAAHTTRPVIGVPIASGSLQGFDSLLSTVMMPPGMPVATVAVGGAENAGLLAAQIIALGDPALAAAGGRPSAKPAAQKVLDSDAEVRAPSSTAGDPAMRPEPGACARCRAAGEMVAFPDRDVSTAWRSTPSTRRRWSGCGR